MRGFTPGKRCFIGFIALACALRAVAQWYAPPTEFHDPVQRVFPVEFARVLAWRENLAGAKVREIAWEVKTDAEGRTTWKLRWVGDDGAPWREQEVAYDAEVLLRGAGYFREVRRQLQTEPWAALRASTAACSDNAFWAALEPVSVSRLGGVRRALAAGKDLAAAPDGETREQVSGRLLVSAVPGVAGLVTLDSTLTARGAAWLALAEGLEAQGAEADRRWAPVLWLSRRERAAQKLWAAPGSPGSFSAEATATRAWWGQLLASRSPNEIYLGAARERTLARQLPLLAYGARLKDRAKLLGAGMLELVDGKESALRDGYDYAFWLWKHGSVEDGHLTQGGWAVEARGDALALLRAEFPAAPKKTRAEALRPEARLESDDPALAGLADAAVELNRDFTWAAAPLAPVAVVTEGDVRAHGFEITGLTLSGRYWFLERRFGDHEASAAFFEQANSLLRGFGTFTAGRKLARGNTVLGPRERVRLERIEHFGAEMAKVTTPVLPSRDAPRALAREALTSGATADAARTFARSDWLMPDRAAAGLERLATTQQHPLFRPLLDRAHAEGGPLLDRRLAQEVLFANFRPSLTAPVMTMSFQQIGGKRVTLPAKPWLDRAGVAEELLADVPEGDPARREAWDQRHASDTHLERARGLERLFWLEPGDDDAEDVFGRYLRAGAFNSAKRFFTEFAPLAQDSVRFSNNLGPRRLMIALLEKDWKGAMAVQRVSDSGSARDLVSDMTHATALGDRAAVAKLVEVYLSRYPKPDPKHMMNVLHDFLPLWPALADPSHADHGRALDHFLECEEWPTLQWFMAEQLNLPTEERIRFLGGESAKWERRMMIAYLRGNQTDFADAFNEIATGRDPHRMPVLGYVVIQFLRAKLFDEFVTEDVRPDRPAKPRSLAQQLHDARG